MDIRAYMETKKYGLLPNIKNFRDPQDHIRKSNDVKNMSYNEWFYCHPSAYKTFHYGVTVIFIKSFLIVSALFAYKGHYFLAILPAIPAIFLVINLIKKIKNRKDIEDTTFYDLYMREY